MKNFFFLFILSFPFLVAGQVDAKDLTSVQATVEDYFYGYVERDSVRLYRAFDTENGTMKLPENTKDGKTKMVNGYFKEIIPRWSNRNKLSKKEENNCRLEITSVDVVNGKMAIVKMKMWVGDKTYFDVLSLQKINLNWKITNKMFIEL